MALMAIFAPYLCTVDPQALSPIKRLRWPSAQYWFGTDMLGRDIYSRTLYGARVSLIVGISVALLASGIGLAIGLVTGFSRWTEAILSFLGAGTPPNIPSWGNIMAEGRSLFQVAYYIVLFPGLFLSITVLAINLLGDGMRDALDPRLARRM